jgi:hypothetical protein
VPPGNLEIPRDQYGRPKIIPVGGGRPRPYARMSTVSKALKDKDNLVNWKARMAAIGLVAKPALMTRLAGEVAMGDLTNYKTKRAIDKIVEEATEAAGASDRASIGTGLHALTEALDEGRALPPVTADVQVRLEEYTAATRSMGYTPLRGEGFVVVDELELAGSYDRLWLCPDGKARIGDLKTGAWDAKEPMGAAAQLAGYARGMHYDPTTGERTPLHPDLDVHEGLLISMPPEGGCEVIPLDLDLGWAVLMLASKVYAMKKIKGKEYRAV